MAITRKPATAGRSAASKAGSTKADAFIRGAKADKKGAADAADATRLPVMMRVPADLLERIDAAAKQRGVSRSAWFLTVASRALDRDDY